MSKVAIQGNASGTGTFTIAAPNSNTDRTLTLPDEAGTVLTSASDIPAANLTGSLPAGMGGKVLQVVQGIKTDTFSTLAGGASPVTITGLTASITPSATSSKILVTVSLPVGTSSDNHILCQLFRDSTAISLGDAAGNRPRAAFYGGVYTAASASTWNMQQAAHTYLDSPSTTSSITYSVKIGGNAAATIYVNRSGRDTNNANEDGRYSATITLMEIAA